MILIIINLVKFCFEFLQELLMLREAISSKLVKKTRLAPRFSTHFSVFGYLMKHSSLCLMYYFSNAGFKLRQFNILRLGLYTALKCVREYTCCGAPRLVLGGLSLCSGAIRFFRLSVSLYRNHTFCEKKYFQNLY